MSDAIRFLHALAQALSAVSLYSPGHPAAAKALEAAWQALQALLARDPRPTFFFLGGAPVYSGRALHELADWPWGARLKEAGVHRLEFDEGVTLVSVTRFLELMQVRFTSGTTDPLFPEDAAFTRVRFGPVAVVDALSEAENEEAPQEDDGSRELALNLTDELEAMAFVLAEARRDVVARAEADAVVRILAAQLDRHELPQAAAPEDHAAYPQFHAVNTALLAMAAGGAAGIDQAGRHRLGMAALLRFRFEARSFAARTKLDFVEPIAVGVVDAVIPRRGRTFAHAETQGERRTTVARERRDGEHLCGHFGCGSYHLAFDDIDRPIAIEVGHRSIEKRLLTAEHHARAIGVEGVKGERASDGDFAHGVGAAEEAIEIPSPVTALAFLQGACGEKVVRHKIERRRVTGLRDDLDAQVSMVAGKSVEILPAGALRFVGLPQPEFAEGAQLRRRVQQSFAPGAAVTFRHCCRDEEQPGEQPAFHGRGKHHARNSAEDFHFVICRKQRIFRPMRTVLCLLLAAFSLAAAPALRADPVPMGPGEYIIVSGGVSLSVWEKWKAAPHDGWWMNFIRAARIRIQEIQAANPNAQITWFVFRHSYGTRGAQDGRDYFSLINSVQQAYRVRLIYFDRTSELLDYMNNGQNRRAMPICNFEYFGHSNKACFMFDYSNNIDSASKVWLHERDLVKIRRGIFSRDAYIKSWGCHTGESFSKKWASATGTRMIGAKGKTQYMDEVLPILSTTGGYWVR